METCSNFQFPPGFRFHPSDKELLVHYLENKVNSHKAMYGEDEWYFFSRRDRKYPNGERPNRAAASGYWKATGTDKPILSCCGSKCILGVKKALTDWIMNGYRLLHMSKPSRSKGSMRLDDWVLCRVRQKGNMAKETCEDQGSCRMGFPQIEEELQATFRNYNADIIMDSPFKNPALISIQTNSGVSFEGSNKSNHFDSVYGDCSNIVNSPTTASTLGIYFNNDMNSYNQNHSHRDIFNSRPTEPLISFQESSGSVFMEMY
ncbi:hypothetical protein I3760_14G081500 [Carya illinoinensis]|nr:hypothetical protein I3760_14G081500 [Carya illinoinensis]